MDSTVLTFRPDAELDPAGNIPDSDCRIQRSPLVKPGEEVSFTLRKLKNPKKETSMMEVLYLVVRCRKSWLRKVRKTLKILDK
jgi:hypothetical protein